MIRRLYSMFVNVEAKWHLVFGLLGQFRGTSGYLGFQVAFAVKIKQVVALRTLILISHVFFGFHDISIAIFPFLSQSKAPQSPFPIQEISSFCNCHSA